MNDQNEKIKEAEAFVRKALAQICDAPVDEATVRAVAKKVSEAVPPYGKQGVKHDRVAA
jgi:hypothetical protein